MGTQATLVYRVQALGISSTKIQPFVAAAPIPLDVLQALGLRIISDTISIPAVNPVVRTVILGFEPTLPALVNPPIISNTSNIDQVTVDVANTGRDYILAPIVRANNNSREPLSEIVGGNVINKRPTQRDALFKSYMAAYDAAQVAPGSGYVAASTKVVFLGGLPPANFNFDFRKADPTAPYIPDVAPKLLRGGCVRYVNIANPGRGYNPATAVLSIQGGGPDGNTPVRPALGILTINPRNGGVQSIAIVDMGEKYVSVPDVFITTTDGIGPKEPAKIYAVMAEGRPARGTAVIGAGPGFPVTAITVTDPGDNYVTVPDILITDTGGGSGAIFRARMGLGRIDTIARGVGYFAGTTFSITPQFEEFFPLDPANPQAQAAAFFQFLQGSISQNAITPLTSVDPLVA